MSRCIKNWARKTINFELTIWSFPFPLNTFWPLMFQGVFQAKTYQPLKVVKVKWGLPKILLFTIEEEHERHMHGMLIRFRSSGRKLNPADKCTFKQREIKFYGIICIEDGVKPHPDKVSALLRLCHPPPPPPPIHRTSCKHFFYTFLAPFISRFNALKPPCENC